MKTLLDWAWNIILSQKIHWGDGFRSRNHFLGAFMWCCCECFQFPILGRSFCRHPQTQACHCWGGTAVPTGLGRPIDLQNPKNAELRSPWASAALLQLGSISNTVTLSAKNCLDAGPASPNGSRNLSMILFMELPLKEKFSQSSKKAFLETAL